MADRKRIQFNRQEMQMLRQALRIAVEDGSLLSDDEQDFAEQEPRYQSLCKKLGNAISSTTA